MGTLFNQRPRSDTLETYFHLMKDALGFMGIDRPTPADWQLACDMVRTALGVQSADVLDEQLAGFGELLSKMVDDK